MQQGLGRVGVDRAVGTEQQRAPAHLVDGALRARGDVRLAHRGDLRLGGQAADDGAAGAPMDLGQRRVAGAERPGKGRHGVIGKLVEVDGRPADVQQVERRLRDGAQHAQVVGALEAAALPGGEAVAAREVRRIEESVGAGLHARARVGRQRLGDRRQPGVHRLRLGAGDGQRLLAPAGQHVRHHHHRREDRPDDRRVGTEGRADRGQRGQLLAERAPARIDGLQPGHLRGAGQRRVRDRERGRALRGRPVAQPPHLGEALRARLGLQEVPVERAGQPQRFRGQPGRGVLGHEVVQPEAERHAVDVIATQGGQHARALGHGHGHLTSARRG